MELNGTLPLGHKWPLYTGQMHTSKHVPGKSHISGLDFNITELTAFANHASEPEVYILELIRI